jgi:hypothetical protein
MATVGRTPTGGLTDSFLLSSREPILNEGRVVRATLKEAPMITKSPAELRRARDRPTGASSRATGQCVRVGSVDVPRVHRGGDTDALDWRSDPHLLAILERGVKREREAREAPWATGATR